MCEFVSFIIDEKENLYFGDLLNHSNIKLPTDNINHYSECEWIENTPLRLTIRVGDLTEYDKSYYRASILGRFKTRKELLEYIVRNNLSTTKMTLNDDGNPHSFNDEPALVTQNGVRYWYQNGIVHRDNDLPALITTNGTKEWCQLGKLHRDNDKPAFITADGSQSWYQNGLMHRDNDQPAYIGSNGTKYWYDHGTLTKVDVASKLYQTMYDKVTLK